MKTPWVCVGSNSLKFLFSAHVFCCLCFVLFLFVCCCFACLLCQYIQIHSLCFLLKGLCVSHIFNIMANTCQLVCFEITLCPSHNLYHIKSTPFTWGRYHGGRRPSSEDNFHSHSSIDTRQTVYHEALPSSANDEVWCDCTFADDGNAS